MENSERFEDLISKIYSCWPLEDVVNVLPKDYQRPSDNDREESKSMAVQERVVIEDLPLQRCVEVIKDDPCDLVNVNDEDPDYFKCPYKHGPNEHEEVDCPVPESQNDVVEEIRGHHDGLGHTDLSDTCRSCVFVIPHLFQALLLGLVCEE